MSIPGANKSYPYWPGNYPENNGGSIIPGMIMLWATATAPTGYLLCNGANVLSSEYPTLLNAIGYTYSAGAANAFGAIAVNGAYTYVSNTITISGRAEQENFFINVGSIVKLIGSTPATGASMTGRAILITSAPPINTTGGIFEGTFVNTLAGTGTGTAGIIDMLRLTFQVPNMADNTVRGAGGEFVLGESGGADDVVLTPSQLPSHAHNTPGVGQGLIAYNDNGVGYGDSGNVTGSAILNTGAEVLDSEFNVVTATSASGTNIPVVNKYIALNYIIKT